MDATSSTHISVLSVTKDEYAVLQVRAEERGYESVEAFVRALIAADAKYPRVHRDAELLREALEDVVAGRTMTLEQMWRDIAEEEATEAAHKAETQRNDG